MTMLIKILHIYTYKINLLILKTLSLINTRIKAKTTNNKKLKLLIDYYIYLINYLTKIQKNKNYIILLKL